MGRTCRSCRGRQGDWSWQLGTPVLNGVLCTCSVYGKLSNPTFTIQAIFWVYGALHKKFLYLGETHDSFTIQAVKECRDGWKHPKSQRVVVPMAWLCPVKASFQVHRECFIQWQDRRLQVCNRQRQIPWGAGHTVDAKPRRPDPPSSDCPSPRQHFERRNLHINEFISSCLFPFRSAFCLIHNCLFKINLLLWNN